MELVINISECTYKAKQRLVANQKRMIDDVDIAIANGTPLPKGHGDLVDRDAIQKAYDYGDIDYSMIDALNDTPTIIEADNLENEEHEHMTADELAELFTERDKE